MFWFFISLQEGSTALMLASRFGHKEVVELLLSANPKADVNHENNVCDICDYYDE